MDDVIRSEISFQNHTNEIYHKRTQPTEGRILERNAKLRKEGVVQDLGSQGGLGGWGRQVASIPFNMWEEAVRDGFELNSRDKDHAAKEMNRYLQSDKGKACLITPKL